MKNNEMNMEATTASTEENQENVNVTPELPEAPSTEEINVKEVNDEMLVSFINTPNCFPCASFAMFCDTKNTMTSLYIFITSNCNDFIDTTGVLQSAIMRPFIEINPPDYIMHQYFDPHSNLPRCFVSRNIGALSTRSIELAVRMSNSITAYLFTEHYKYSVKINNKNLSKILTNLVDKYRNEYISGKMPKPIKDHLDKISILIPKVNKLQDDVFNPTLAKEVDKIFSDASKTSLTFIKKYGESYIDLFIPFTSRLISNEINELFKKINRQTSTHPFWKRKKFSM